jgi:hypothetical protein
MRGGMKPFVLRKGKRPRLVCLLSLTLLLSLTATVLYLEKSHLTLGLFDPSALLREPKPLQLPSRTHSSWHKGGISSYCDVWPSAAGYHRHSLGVVVEYAGRRTEAEMVTPAAFWVCQAAAGYRRHGQLTAAEYLGRRPEAEMTTPAWWCDVCEAAAGRRHGPVTAAEYLGRRPEAEMMMLAWWCDVSEAAAEHRDGLVTVAEHAGR